MTCGRALKWGTSCPLGSSLAGSLVASPAAFLGSYSLRYDSYTPSAHLAWASVAAAGNHLACASVAAVDGNHLHTRSGLRVRVRVRVRIRVRKSRVWARVRLRIRLRG